MAENRRSLLVKRHSVLATLCARFCGPQPGMAPSGKPKRLPNFKLLHEREQARAERFKVRRRAARHFMLGSGGPQPSSCAHVPLRARTPAPCLRPHRSLWPDPATHFGCPKSPRTLIQNPLVRNLSHLWANLGELAPNLQPTSTNLGKLGTHFASTVATLGATFAWDT